MRETFPFYTPDLDRPADPANRPELTSLIELLNDPLLTEQIDQGNVSLALIRPHVGPQANLLNLPDQEAAEHIEEMIAGLGVMAKFSFFFSRQAADTFYDNAREQMRQTAPKDNGHYTNRWDEYCDFMASGPTTALLLYSPDGQAIERWRAHLGHWNIDANRDPNTIRGQLGVDRFNNLVHGSDSPESVHRELNIISDLLFQEFNHASQP